MTVSIIIPVYNVEKYLKDCLDSVICQTYKDIEIILIDDGSPDNCPQICDDYSRSDTRIRVIHQVNGGLSKARNSGLKIAHGEYVIFLDSDDYWLGNDSLERCVQDLEKYHPDVLMFERTTYYENGKVTIPGAPNISFINGYSREDAIKALMRTGKFIISACCKFVRRGILEEHNVFFKEGVVSEDLDWTFQMIPYISVLRGFHLPFYAYRKREGSITQSIGRKNIEDLLDIIKFWSSEIKSRESNETVRDQLLGYLNYQSFIAMGLVAKIDRAERERYLNHLEELSWLNLYDINKKTHLAFWARRLFGRHSYKLLSFYMRLHSKGFHI